MNIQMIIMFPTVVLNVYGKILKILKTLLNLKKLKEFNDSKKF